MQKKKKKKKTWAGETVLFCAMCFMTGSFITTGSSSLAPGLAGEPKGEYASTTIPKITIECIPQSDIFCMISIYAA